MEREIQESFKRAAKLIEDQKEILTAQDIKNIKQKEASRRWILRKKYGGAPNIETRTERMNEARQARHQMNLDKMSGAQNNIEIDNMNIHELN